MCDVSENKIVCSYAGSATSVVDVKWIRSIEKIPFCGSPVSKVLKLLDYVLPRR